MNNRKGIRVAMIAALAAVIVACSGGGDSNNGTISVSMMDRPVDAVQELNITVTEFWIKPQGNGPAFQLDMVDTPVTANLLELSLDEPAIFVERANIPAGTYSWLEMKVDDSNSSAAHAMTDEGEMIPVDIDVPSDRVRLINNFEVEPNDSVRLLFDWDVRKGLTEAVGRNLYVLKPVIRVLDVDEFGAVVGKIASTTVTASGNNCNSDSAISMDYSVGNVIYIFEGDVEPDEIGGVVEPYTTVEAKDEDNDGDYEYRAAVMPGTYTIAATCQGGIDTDLDDQLDTANFFLTPLSGDSVVTFVAADIDGPTF